MQKDIQILSAFHPPANSAPLTEPYDRDSVIQAVNAICDTIQFGDTSRESSHRSLEGAIRYTIGEKRWNNNNPLTKGDFLIAFAMISARLHGVESAKSARENRYSGQIGLLRNLSDTLENFGVSALAIDSRAFVLAKDDATRIAENVLGKAPASSGMRTAWSTLHPPTMIIPGKGFASTSMMHLRRNALPWDS